MPDNTGEEKDKRTEKRLVGKGMRKMHFGLSPDEARRWHRFFSVALILVIAVLALTVAVAINHYNLYPGRVERDSICSPGRGLQYPISANDLKREIAAALSQFSSPSTFSVEVVAKDNIAVFVDDP